MKNQWSYGSGAEISGPVSDTELFDIAANGTVLRTDTIWRNDVESGVSAAKVKNLFPELVPIPVSAPPLDSGDLAVVHSVSSHSLHPATLDEDDQDLTTPDAAAADSPSISVVTPPPRPARASAGTGAIIVSQDGKTVKYRGKCTTCGRDDTSWRTMAIPRGTRSTFFCPKSRKRREIQINRHH